MSELLFFIICLGASAAGAISGFGGGVIIKPLLDTTGLLPVDTVSFLSGCTVLAMSLSSTIRGRKSDIKINLSTSVPIAVGAAAGGVSGSLLIGVIKRVSGHVTVIGLVQAVVLSIVVIAVSVYVLKKEKFRTYELHSISATGAAGLFMGLLSAFLGIGGGPINIAVLQICFSMDTKTASKCSIFIILFSQIASLLSSIVCGTIPEFSWLHLAVMAVGGVGGAIIGGKLNKHMTNSHVDKLILALLAFVLCINIRNIVRFGMSL